MESFFSKAERKLHYIFWNRLRPGGWSKWLYAAEWKAAFSGGEKDAKEACSGENSLYLTALPNPGAGVGHQLGNWLAGLHFAKAFGLPYAHIPLTGGEWEAFLGLGECYPAVAKLKGQGYKIRKLPRFDEGDTQLINHIKELIRCYNGEKIIFRLERDQFCRDLFEETEEFRSAFRNAAARKRDPELIWKKDPGLHAAMHIRRGDVGGARPVAGYEQRWMSGSYYRSVYELLIKLCPGLRFYVFTEGGEQDFPELSGLPGLTFTGNVSARETFLHFVKADILVSAKSSFSYKPALLSEGLKLSPADFWHGVPDTPDFVLMDNTGAPLEGQTDKILAFLRTKNGEMP